MAYKDPEVAVQMAGEKQREEKTMSEYTKGECDCLIEEVVFTYSTGQSGIKPQIIYCPLHKSAPDLYEALEGLMELQEIDNGSVVVRACPSSESILKAQEALAKGEGG